MADPHLIDTTPAASDLTVPNHYSELACNLNHSRRRLLVTSLIILLPIILLAGAWRLGGVSAMGDDLVYYFPIRQYIGQQIRQGALPLWNPLIAMGTLKA